jgi:hypothetical protein
MEKCLNCGTEFDANTGKCPKCISHIEGGVECICLTTVANDIEFEMVAGLLQMGDIPVVRKVRGVDGFIQIILGMPIAGIDVFVPKDRFQEALELLNSDINEEDFFEVEKKTE